MTDRPLTYQQVWDQYAAGKVSTFVMRRLLSEDEVFRQWCIRKAEAKRKASAGERLIKAAGEALAIAKGEMQPAREHIVNVDMPDGEARDIKAQQMISDEDMA